MTGVQTCALPILKKKETGTEHVDIATSKFGIFLEVYRACQDSYWGILNHIGSKNSFGLPGYTVVPFDCSLEKALKQDVNSNSPLIIKHLRSSDRVQRMKVSFRDSKENSKTGLHELSLWFLWFFRCYLLLFAFLR